MIHSIDFLGEFSLGPHLRVRGFQSCLGLLLAGCVFLCPTTLGDFRGY